MQRRHFLRLGAASLAGMALFSRNLFAQQTGMHSMHDMKSMGHMGNMGGMMKGMQPANLLPVDALPAGAPLVRLKRLANSSDQAKLFRATLTAAPTSISLIPSKQTTVWAYNGSIPGPLIEVHEGDTVEIHFINRLPQPTTVHWHGLPVPADQDGNPHDPVGAGEARTYRFTLPKGSAGTYWYHPHPHGDTPEQTYRGLAGLFIVRAADDPLAGFPEQHLAISDLRLDRNATIPDNTMFDWMNGREGQFALINGQREPRIDVSGTQRLRIWNACSARYLRLALPGYSFIVVGSDGGLLEAPRPPVQELLLAPAERAEVIIKGPDGKASLMALAYDRSKMGPAAPEKDRVLAQVHISGTSSPSLPLRLRPIADPGVVNAKKRVVFSEDMSMMESGMDMDQDMMKDHMSHMFLVNGKSFDMQRVDLTSKAGDVEEWEIVNDSHMDHPFHIHGTQFLILERERKGKKTPEPYRAWKDTVNLRPNETIRIKMMQTRPGLRMFHCHILEHEGLGMMATLKVA